MSPETGILAASLKAIGDRLDEHERNVQQRLDLILEQTTATNGRLREIEAWRIEQDAIAHERTRAQAELEENRDQAMTRRDTLRNIILGAILALLTGVIAAFAADIHPFS